MLKEKNYMVSGYQHVVRHETTREGFDNKLPSWAIGIKAQVPLASSRTVSALPHVLT